ncbi:MAG: DNA polymerase ligase N-terminal domain-containing protein [Myxococcota bacterium]
MGELDAYRRLRNFEVTPEPGDGSNEAGLAGLPRPLFVVQKHAARRLHYDLRLESEGALLSWAVPRGPTMVPGIKRLAVPTEDHPLAYADFEGVIPEPGYGAGTMLVWDRGVFRPLGPVRTGLEAGKLDFELEGEKLMGRFHLIQTRAGWLWVKGKDSFAQSSFDPETLPRSVRSGLTLEEVRAAGPAR